MVSAGTESGSILIVEDDETVSEVVGRYLENEGFSVRCVTDGADALERARSGAYDLILLDIGIPGLDGFEVCRRLRTSTAVPVIMLTARGEEDDRVAGLELGADDYVSKPFSPRELTARVRSVLRRANGPLPLASRSDMTVLSAGPIDIDVPAHQARRDGAVLELTSLEFDLLVFFALHPETVFTREQIMEAVWGYSVGDVSTVTVHVRRLRGKIEDDPAHPNILETVWGVGYRMQA